MRHLSPLLVALLVVIAVGAAPLAAEDSSLSAADCDTELPTAPLPSAAGGDEADLLATMPLEVKIGQMMMAGVQNTTVGDDERHLIADLHLGNVILMGRNVEAPEQVLALTQGLQELAAESNGIGLLIATDQEGGLVQRLNYVAGFTLMPDAAIVGLARCPAVVRAYGRMAGEEMAAVGVNMAMAPVLDVNTNPHNPVIGALGRSFGATPELVEVAALPFIAGVHDAGVLATGKHFPGHGRTTEDSHLSMPFVEASRAALDAVDLPPFAAAIDLGIDAIMPAHVVYPALDPSDRPATVSEPIQTGILRDTLGFEGVIVTDDMGMKGITERYTPEESGVQAVLAGADVLLCVRNPNTDTSCTPEMFEALRDGLLQAVADGRIPQARVDASVRRVLTAKARADVDPAPSSDLATIDGAAHIRAVADLLEVVAVRQEEAGKP